MPWKRVAVATDKQVSDAEIRDDWRKAGGGFHGPHVEHAYIEEAKFLPYMRAKFTALAEREREVEAKQLTINMLKIDVAKLDKAIEQREAAEAREQKLKEALLIARNQVITLHPAGDPRLMLPRDSQDLVQIAVLHEIDSALTAGDAPKEEQRG